MGSEREIGDEVALAAGGHKKQADSGGEELEESEVGCHGN